mgnify:CR=1 FL=1
MKAKKKIIGIVNTIGKLWERKIVKLAIIVHLIYFTLSITLLFIFFRDYNDFLVYYKVGGVFLEDITNLYNQENYLWEFRYFPLSAIFFVPYYLLGFELGFIAFHITNLILNSLVCILMYKIILLIKPGNNNQSKEQIILYIFLFLMGLPQMFNYVLGQINLFITVLMLISLYIFIKYENGLWNFIGALILGLSFVIKPTLIFIIPFLVAVKVDLKEKKMELNFKDSFIKLFGAITPILLNFLLFLLIPELWEGFLRTNLTREALIEMNFSFSITRNVINGLLIFGVLRHHLIILLIITFIVGAIALAIYIFGKFGSKRLIFGYTLGLLVLLLSYFDSWDHHLLTLLPLIIILLFALPPESEISRKYLKPAFFFLNFLDLAFMGLWFLIKPIFPFHITTTIFLIVILIGIGKYGLYKNTNNNIKSED